MNAQRIVTWYDGPSKTSSSFLWGGYCWSKAAPSANSARYLAIIDRCQQQQTEWRYTIHILCPLLYINISL
ncbi:hypothetical protein I312_101230 [Cryptococcus bacillisporus CA1280]|uniref:uncharacterized protein n=1 Tax=Cryptococcus bacillisporus CA1280 TaxID=1296109 RepID=UPI003366E623